MTVAGVQRTRLIVAVVLAVVAAAVIFAVIGAAGHDNRDAFADSRPPPDLAERFYPPENWAWGELQPAGGSVQRYGVSAPAVYSRADVLILPDYGESAETWFETARDLNAAGYTVWVLEGVGQGGSARLSGHRDLGELRSFDGDVGGVRGMIDAVIRPAPGRPLVLMGEGVGALLAARRGLVRRGPERRCAERAEMRRRHSGRGAGPHRPRRPARTGRRRLGQGRPGRLRRPSQP